ncbi:MULTISPECIES: glutamine--fructose-6-phosphate transaminase (isomerizing) [Methylobacterium]|uniref:Glutamine--fructose-6-phosphate aminotransferase [isomerizing] n=4 Tax=Pseudomonadota TaxID=1224 RepID=A0ABQ4T003_9HYPH|nr:MULTISPECIES: glutamine--fructose-6-phosphate transaminase (isomerizing) [Methylobacterium]PIU08499.1 MAG: glutamine--fructose-6-phosphate transaminase (isomerizing) [Methylobacterium sp. CG09_land_8_20_14_0_10_71_15]PIU15154.1 MAG: glutamine--fructose-6-phosphate transaminase (isomerizing) [Methylobacterium sp. CG08_land_8_20_14_0_20_71_15]GBU19198.1 L-glutamine:D-fructose-6-phosphate aminotransferase [Methylobacterium sp.]GJE08134.1 Glutamine--fructose-6-phosphate aminotransferase [isomeri
MCGIVGIVGREGVAGHLVEALRRLEYRGYDSAGVATLEHGRLERRRAEGKLVNLEAKLAQAPLAGAIGIGHTRWATHGRPNETNAHPHATKRLAVVHNGIIENFRELKAELEAAGVRFESQTDTEVVAQLVSHLMDGGLGPVEAVAAALPRLHGAFALGFLFAGGEDLLIGARHGAPLAIGFGEGATYLGSDALALAPFTSELTYLEEGDWAILSRAGAEIRDADGRAVERPRQTIATQAYRIDKGNHRHFMGKEIHEQPEVVGRTLSHYVDLAEGRVVLPEALPFDFGKLNRLYITACGTAYYAGLVARYWFEQIARLPVEIDVASEARYREAPLERDGLTLVISQSGETADTLASLRYAKSQGQHTLCVVNVPTSTIARESSVVMPTLAGPEIGVASTKAFACQLTVLLCLAIAAGRARGTLTAERERALIDALITVPGLMAEALKQEGEIEGLAREVARARDVLYLGRGTSYPMALEGALKLKEISYIHAEGYAAGELKHGPIALIDESVPVIVIAPHDGVFEKTVSNMQEVAARGGRIILIGDAKGAAEHGLDTLATLTMPDLDATVAPLVYALPIQLIAYHTAVFMGKDVDQPRNLAKSVTVE